MIKWSQERVSVAVETTNGSNISGKSLVDYPDDDDDEEADIMDTKLEGAEPEPEATLESSSTPPPPPERLAEKRRREEEDEDELVKLAAVPKRRSSTSSNSGAGSILRKKSLSGSSADKNAGVGVKDVAPKKIAINIGSTGSKPDNTGVESQEKENRENKDHNEG